MAKVGRPRKRRAHEKAHQWHILAMERRRKALELRMQGLSYKEIGLQLGCGAVRAGQLVRSIMATRVAECDDLVREQAELQNARLDVAVKALWPEIVKGDVDSIQAMVRIEERRARLHGLDAPQKIQAEVDLRQMPPEELMAIAKRIGLDSIVVSGEDGSIEEIGADTKPPALLAAPIMPANVFDRLAEQELKELAELEPDIPPMATEPPPYESLPEPSSPSDTPAPSPDRSAPSDELPPAR